MNIKELAKENGYNIHFMGSGESSQSEHKFLEMVEKQRLTGVIMTPISEEDHITREKLIKMQGPVMGWRNLSKRVPRRLPSLPLSIHQSRERKDFKSEKAHQCTERRQRKNRGNPGNHGNQCSAEQIKRHEYHGKYSAGKQIDGDDLLSLALKMIKKSCKPRNYWIAILF